VKNTEKGLHNKGQVTGKERKMSSDKILEIMKLVSIYGQKRVDSFDCVVYSSADRETREKLEKEKSEAYLAIQDALYAFS